MSRRTLNPTNVVAAILVLGGLLMVLMPRHTISILQIVILSTAAAAGIHALAVNVPLGSAAGWSMSPFNRRTYSERQRLESHEVHRIRAKFDGARFVTPDGPAVPVETIQLLKPLILTALRQEGVDPDRLGRASAARSLLSPQIRAVLDCDPPRRPGWRQTRPANEQAVAQFVDQLLDDLDRLPGRLRES